MFPRITPHDLVTSPRLLLLCGTLWAISVWGAFTWFYSTDIALERIARASTTPDPVIAQYLYHQMAPLQVHRYDIESFAKLGEVLDRANTTDAALDIWRRVVATVPDNRGLRLRLALTLHRTGRYIEAEYHFSTLLGDSPR